MSNLEDFRRQCEARHVMKMPRTQRQQYYDGVFKNRKQKGLDDLITEVKKQYQQSREEMER